LGELKFGDKALDKVSGLHAHVDDVNRYLADPTKVVALKQEMIEIFHQKRELNLIECNKDLIAFSEERPLLLLLLANHDPDKRRLPELLRALPKSEHADIGIASSCLLGYGLYAPAILTPEQAEQALARFKTCI
jgi:hypothetical protein